eukprot:3725183-Amphidinium_carterae.2
MCERVCQLGSVELGRLSLISPKLTPVHVLGDLPVDHTIVDFAQIISRASVPQLRLSVLASNDGLQISFHEGAHDKRFMQTYQCRTVIRSNLVGYMPGR